jgi:hypothetical protein
VINTAAFWSNTFNYDPLFASDVISQSAKIAPSLGVLKRGQVLFGPAAGTPITGATNLTTSTASGSARVVLAQDIDTGTGAAVTGLVYTCGNFLDTALTFTAQGAAIDAAQLWNFDIHVMTVEQRSGILVPMMSLPATGGPLPQALSPAEAKKQTQQEVDAIKAALEAWKPGMPGVPIAGMSAASKDPAWAVAAFGARPETKAQQAQDQAAEKADELAAKQQKELEDLLEKQRKELAELGQKQQQETQKALEDAQKQIQQAQAQQTPPSDNPGNPGNPGTEHHGEHHRPPPKR